MNPTANFSEEASRVAPSLPSSRLDPLQQDGFPLTTLAQQQATLRSSPDPQANADGTSNTACPSEKLSSSVIASIFVNIGSTLSSLCSGRTQARTLFIMIDEHRKYIEGLRLDRRSIAKEPSTPNQLQPP